MIRSPVVLGPRLRRHQDRRGGLRAWTGTRLASATVASGGELGARASFDRGIQAARDLLAAFAPGRELAAVGVSTFGIPFEDRVDLAPADQRLGRPPLGRELRAAFPGAAIRMATDAKAAAQAEVRWGALAGCDPAIYLNLGTGLSAALVVGGQVLAGAHGAAGEIGYNLRALADVGLPLDARVAAGGHDQRPGPGPPRGRPQPTAQPLPSACGRCSRPSAARTRAWTGWSPSSLPNWHSMWSTWPSA